MAGEVTYKYKTPGKPLVSVIMPVYKVEDYVGKAIESIQAQKNPDGSAFADWELFAVDDGTPDRSGDICEEYAAKDQRIHVLHQANAGAHAARNSAMKRAEGKYFFFMDSDDWTEPETLSELCSLAEENEADLVVSGFYIDTYTRLVMKDGHLDEASSRYMTSHYIPEPGIFESKESFRKAAYRLFDKNMFYPPWNKLYRADYLKENELYFPDTYRDDFPFVLSVIRDIERVVVTGKEYYHFLRARSESETSKYVPKLYEKREEEHGWMEELYEHWGLGDDPDALDMISRRYIDRVIECCENLTNRNCSLNTEEKKAAVKKMLENPRTIRALRYAKPAAPHLKLMYLPVRLKSTVLTMLMASTITFVKTHFLRLFVILKTGR